MAAPSQAYLTAVQAASAKYHVPAQLLAAQIQAESGWNPNAKSPAGAVGISQFMPATAKGMGIDPTNPLASIDAQGRMMGRLINQYHGNVDEALAAYNAGSGAVAKYGGIPPFPETKSYISNIHAYEKNYPHLAAAVALSGVTPPTIDSKGTQTAPNGFTLQNGVSTQANKPNALGTLLDYAMKGSKPAEDGGSSTGDILNVLTQGGDIPAPTVFSAGDTTITPPPAAAGHANSTIVSAAEKFLGTPYLWGGTSAKGLDCSGLVQLAVKNATGKDIPRVASAQYAASTKVPMNKLQPGDVIAFGTPSNVHHIGIYVGNGKFINAPHTGTKVRIDSLAGRDDVVGAGRFS